MKIRNLFFVSLLLLAGCKSSPLEHNLGGNNIINFTVPYTGKMLHVHLIIENSYGKVIGTYFDEDCMGGQEYSAWFPHDQLPEGIYFFALEMTDLSTGEIHKMIGNILLVRHD
jgi:hypothetical protein